MATDELRADGTALTVHIEREYAATVEEVWDAWTDPARLSRWLATPAGPLSSQPTRLDFGGEGDWADVAIVRAERPRLLELRWSFAGGVESLLRVEIVALAEGRVRLVLDHRGLGDSTVGYGAGWAAYLVDLGVELGAAGAGSSWEERFGVLLPEWRARAIG